MQFHHSFIFIKNLSKREVNVQFQPIPMLLNHLLIHSGIYHGER